MSRHFDDAWRSAVHIGEGVATDGHDVVIVRDLLGRASVVVVERTGRELSSADQESLVTALRSECSPFVGPEPLLRTREMFAPEAILDSPDVLVVREPDEASGRGRLSVFDRGVTGRDWSQQGARPPESWATLYGFKGGVGRSTAAAVLARYLAFSGKCVLVVDLDLESPGVSSVALAPEDEPDFGIIDLLVEAAVGNENGLDCVTRSSRLRGRGNGEVWVAPAGGRPSAGYTYAPKLNRVYLDLPGSQTENGLTVAVSFAERIRRAVQFCADEVGRRSRMPDIVLLDSRAGMHDIAAAAITLLSGTSFLFGVDNNQTWAGYAELFRQWRMNPDLTRAIRERLKMVAAMVPAAQEAEYLARFRDKAQLLFAEYLYDDVDAGDAGDAGAYNPSLSDDSAPHSPLPILFGADLVGLDVSAGAEWLDQEFVGAAYARFVSGCADLLLDGEVADR